MSSLRKDLFKGRVGLGDAANNGDGSLRTTASESLEIIDDEEGEEKDNFDESFPTKYVGYYL